MFCVLVTVPNELTKVPEGWRLGKLDEVKESQQKFHDNARHYFENDAARIEKQATTVCLLTLACYASLSSLRRSSASNMSFQNIPFCLTLVTCLSRYAYEDEYEHGTKIAGLEGSSGRSFSSCESSLFPAVFLSLFLHSARSGGIPYARIRGLPVRSGIYDTGGRSTYARSVPTRQPRKMLARRKEEPSQEEGSG